MIIHDIISTDINKTAMFMAICIKEALEGLNSVTLSLSAFFKIYEQCERLLNNSDDVPDTMKLINKLLRIYEKENLDGNSEMDPNIN